MNSSFGIAQCKGQEARVNLVAVTAVNMTHFNSGFTIQKCWNIIVPSRDPARDRVCCSNLCNVCLVHSGSTRPMLQQGLADVILSWLEETAFVPHSQALISEKKYLSL